MVWFFIVLVVLVILGMGFRDLCEKYGWLGCKRHISIISKAYMTPENLRVVVAQKIREREAAKSEVTIAWEKQRTRAKELREEILNTHGLYGAEAIIEDHAEGQSYVRLALRRRKHDATYELETPVQVCIGKHFAATTFLHTIALFLIRCEERDKEELEVSGKPIPPPLRISQPE